MKNILLIILFVFSVKVQAQDQSNPIKATSSIEKNDGTSSEQSHEKIDDKELEDVFMRVKRIENILTPKKKLYKKKYTIA